MNRNQNNANEQLLQPEIQLFIHSQGGLFDLDTTDPEYLRMAQNIGKVVRYKKATCILEGRKYHYEIVSLQKNYAGRLIYRGRCLNYDDNFGRPFAEDQVVFVKENN